MTEPEPLSYEERQRRIESSAERQRIDERNRSAQMRIAERSGEPTDAILALVRQLADTPTFYPLPMGYMPPEPCEQIPHPPVPFSTIAHSASPKSASQAISLT